MTTQEFAEKFLARLEDMKAYDEVYVATIKRWIREILDESN